MKEHGYISGPELLSQFLNSNGVPTNEWGQGKYKSIDHLYKEVVEEETTFEVTPDGKILRVLKPITINIWHEDKKGKTLLLKEVRQEFLDGSDRKRTFIDGSVSGKIKRGETATGSARREILEELGFSYDGNLIPERTEISIRESESFPGLATKYYLTVMSAQINDHQYNSEGYIEVQDRIKTVFEWREVPTRLLDYTL